jgi:glycosyltransferase involved in cell wall biosynthesis
MLLGRAKRVSANARTGLPEVLKGSHLDRGRQEFRSARAEQARRERDRRDARLRVQPVTTHCASKGQRSAIRPIILSLYLYAVPANRKLSAIVRHRLGNAVHRAGGATRAGVRLLRSELQALRDELGAVLGSLEHSVDSLERRADQVKNVAARIDSVAESLDQTERAQRDGAARLAALESLAQIDAVSRFIRHATLRTKPLVSVVLPTRDRPDHLRRAIASVVRQRYERWELLVVDDGGELDLRTVVEEAADNRIRWTRIDNRGVCGARNAALEIARGSLIAYLDDDNLMEPDWLYSLVWGFEQRPDIEVVYGAFVIDDLLRVDGSSSGELPRTLLNPWSREALRRRNLADIGAIAHRSGLPEARFDEGLREMGDWDLLIRLTAERDPLVLPVVACHYTTDALNRLTAGPTHAADLATVTDRAGSRNGDREASLGLEPLAGRRVRCVPLARRPTVSVVIPCHNYARFLAAAVGSVTAQTGVDVDVLIIDDCSTDGTRRLAESLAETDPRVRVAVHEHNVGHIATYNEGISSADGEYLVLLSADDLLSPGSLARAIALLEAHPAVAFAYGDVVMFERDSAPAARQAVDGWTIWEGHDWIQERCRAGGNAVCSPEVVMRISVQRQIGEYRAVLPHSADMEMWLRAATVGGVGRIEGADQAFYRVHSDSLSHALCVRPTDDLRARHDAFASVLATPSAVGEGEALYRHARRALAAAALWQASEGHATLAADDVDELEAFALEMFPGAKETPQWLELELRRSAAAPGPSPSGS